MTNYDDLQKLESLFIEKLQEKYKLNTRDLKKAFSRFDLDGNGLLDLDELQKGIGLFLNGVKESRVRALVQKYDVNGDGKLAYEEFLQMLLTRSVTQSEYGPDDASSVASWQSRPNSRASSSRGGYGGGGGGYDDYSQSQYDDDSSSYGAPSPQRNNYTSVAEQNRQTKRQMISGKVGGGASSSGRYGRTVAGGGNSNNARSKNILVPDDRSDDYQPSDVGTEIDVTNPKELEYRAKIFLQNMKSYLIKKATTMRMTGKMSRPHQVHTSELYESTARELLAKSFQRYTGMGDGRARENITGVSLTDFGRVLRSYIFPGAQPIRQETIQFLFALCATPEATVVSEDGLIAIDPEMLTDLIFGAPKSRKDQERRGIYLPKGPALAQTADDTLNDSIARLELTAGGGLGDAGDVHTKPARGFVARVDAGRESVGTGPVVLPDPADAKQQKAMELLAVPMRFVSRKSRTALTVPSNFDPVVGIKRSKELPPYDLVRKHVFGMSTSTYSGNKIYVLPSVPPAFRARALHRHGEGAAAGGGGGPGEHYVDSACVVYASAGLGVVHNLNDNTQLYFDGHNDDISCITVSRDGTLAATGCMGKYPVVCVWPTNIPMEDAKKPIATLGYKFFARAVCAVEFSWDNKYIVAVSCDDNSMLAIFDVKLGHKLHEVPAQHGVPPQIFWLRYCPQQQFTEYITREHTAACDLFASAGDHHIKLWSFRRPTGGSSGDRGSLQYKAPTVGSKSKVSAAKQYNCCSFIYCEDKSYDFVAGGSNGVVYLWRKGLLVASCQAMRGKVQALVVHNDKVFIGGSSGATLKVLDGRTLTSQQEFNLVPAENATGSVVAGGKKAAQRPGSSSSSGRPRSASVGRPGATARAPLSAPKNRSGAGGEAGAAAGAPTSRGVSGDLISGPAPGDAVTAADSGVDSGSGARCITGLAVVASRGPGGAAGGGGTYVLATIGTGKMVRVDIAGTGRPGSAGAGGAVSNDRGRDLMYFHSGSVYGLAADVSRDRRLMATVCDDKKLMVWDAEDCVLIAKTLTESPCRTCHIDKTNSFVATGATSGAVAVYFLSDQLSQSGNYYRITESAYRKDAKGEITEVKFSPSNDMIAAGSRDDSIYIYSCGMSVNEVSGKGRNIVQEGRCILRAMHKLRGHSSTITHLDWSEDSRLLQSTSQAYELLYWDVKSGTPHLLGGAQSNNADIRWKTNHCVLGFNVMGIWPPYSDGTDVNAIDVATERGIVATANDADGLVKLFNYPCVVKNAPAKDYTGHSSHVTNIKFMRGGGTLMTTGGHDSSVVVWDVVPNAEVNNPDQFY